MCRQFLTFFFQYRVFVLLLLYSDNKYIFANLLKMGRLYNNGNGINYWWTFLAVCKRRNFTPKLFRPSEFFSIAYLLRTESTVSQLVGCSNQWGVFRFYCDMIIGLPGLKLFHCRFLFSVESRQRLTAKIWRLCLNLNFKLELKSRTETIEPTLI